MKLKFDFWSRCSTVLLLLLTTVGFAMAQRTISGVITDAESGEPLIGANILVVGTSIGTITDFDGNYQLELPAEATAIRISYTGYAEQDVDVANGTTFNIEMSEGTALDEVVVVGYGTVKRRDVTGSVASLKEEDFNQGVVISSDQLLQGRVAGVNIVNNSGQPGGAATVKIRGNNSIRSGADPLYVVDGVPLDGRTAKASFGDFGNIENSNPLNFLNPSDIASIEVLKDASSAAIYGARAANGVILITTKRALPGKLDVNLNASVGTSSILKKYDVLTGDEYRSALSQYGLSGDGGSSVDAFDEILRNGTAQNYNLSVGTGSDNARVRFSVGYQDVQGIVKESGLQRYNATLNAQYKMLDDRIGFDVFVVSSQTDEEIAPVTTDAGFTGNLVGQALQWNPTVPLMTNGEFTTALNNPLVGNTTINPLQFLSEYDERASTTNILGSISPYWNITSNLQYRYRLAVNYGVGTTRGRIGQNVNIEGINPFEVAAGDQRFGLAGRFNNRLVTTLHTHTLNFTPNVGNALDLNLLAGYEYQRFDFSGSGLSARGFDKVEDGFDFGNSLSNSFNGARNVFSFADPLVELQSYFARAIVGLGENFTITGTVRADGSSKFGENNKYGIFPSFAAAYNLAGLDGIKGGFFDDLRVRAGWGLTGNQEFPAGSSIDRVGLRANGGQNVENAGNPDLRWEQSSTLNVGVDFAFFDYKVSGTVEYYNRTTTDLLLDPFIQEPGPPVRAWRNIEGELVNTGVEVALNVFLVENSNFTFNIGGNVAFLQNEFRDYFGPDILTGNLFGQGSSGAFVQKHINENPLNTYFLREYTGLGADGTSQFNNEGSPVLLEADPNADVIAGITLSLSAGNLNFGMNWNGAFGHQLFNNTAMSVIPIGNLGSRNIDAALIGGDVQESIANPIASSTRYLEDGDFLKLANTTLSYSFGDVGQLKNLTISLTGQNLLIFTNYSGFDPEINTVNLRNGVPSSGIEYIPYPSARTVLLGVNTSF
ncbi:MAG: SusC/RagA family TonB-linked outer membrane protein [Bacteroidota bacterium]